MAGRARKCTEHQFIDALNACKGRPSAMARHLKIGLRTVDNYFDRWPELRVLQQQYREERIDAAEDVLEKAVLAGEAWAVCFFLKTQAKHRGYSERFEVSGTDGGPIEVKTFHDMKKLSDGELEQLASLVAKAEIADEGGD